MRVSGKSPATCLTSLIFSRDFMASAEEIPTSRVTKRTFFVLYASWMLMITETDVYNLALRARAGDEDALSELVERTRLRLFRLAYAELRHYEDAQDVVVAALHQICLHINQLQKPDCANAWMNSIVRNEIHQWRRTSVPTTFALIPEEIGSEARTSDCLLRIDVEQALKRLPRDQARVIDLFYWRQLSTQEIAEQLERPEGTVRRWLHLGRRRLAVEMREYRMNETMTAKAAPVAAIIHSELGADTIQQLKKALRAGGYRTRILPSAQLTGVFYRTGFVKSLCEYAVIVLDEWIDGRNALEFVLHMKGNTETADIPVCLLCASPSDFTVGAYYSAGVDRLVERSRSEEIARLQLLDNRLKGKRVVVCEEEEITRTQITIALNRAGLSVVGTAANSQESVAVVLRERPDIVLMDIHMPVMDGLEATREILAQASVCVVMLTADTDHQEQARLAGASGHITMPLTGDILRLRLQEALDRFYRAHKK